MNKKQFTHWKKYLYPVTIINDRYMGTYSGGRFTAWPLFEGQLPYGPSCCDGDCADFWDKKPKYVGKGETPQEAYENLIKIQVGKIVDKDMDII